MSSADAPPSAIAVIFAMMVMAPKVLSLLRRFAHLDALSAVAMMVMGLGD